ncbi:SMC-Scp complex subunit ScpB [Terriglobus roseus]|uniref:Condensin subunit ScpB n=1 Tax=Terriglobus roseus TaxID=392734 RepID=A0A1G7KYP5_9BACT|nr:SMC-Scp complex subunit ScpB [Terriglobus roseus]SDF42368.1 condensin subunit ScpB [Terriglobus roseus]
MSLKSKIEAVIYASEEPVTLAQLVGLLAGEAQDELDTLAADQATLPLDEGDAEVSPSEGITEEAALDEAIEAAEAVESTSDSEASAAPEEAPAASAEEPAEAAPSEEQASEATEGASASDEQTAEAAEPGAVDSEEDKRVQRDREKAVREHIRRVVDSLIREYAESDRGIEIREVASGFRMGTKPEYHDAVRGFVKSLKPPLKLTLPALETLAVVAYKQPVTAAEISEIRGVDSAGVLGGLMTRKLIATAGRKQVIGRPMLYKTTRDFLLRFGLKDVNELPSMEEFERMAGELAEQEDLPMESADAIIEEANARGDAEMLREAAEADTEPTATEEETSVAESEEQTEAASSEDETTVSEDGDQAEVASSEVENAVASEEAEAPASVEIVAEDIAVVSEESEPAEVKQDGETQPS